MIRKVFFKYELQLVKENDIEYDNKISSRAEAYEKILEVFKLNQKPEEHFVMFCLDNKNRIIGAFTVFIGSIDRIDVSISDIIKRVLLCNSCKIIVAHNHPSGDSTPSNQDKKFNKILSDACKLMNIQLLDHFVIGDNCFNTIS